MRRLFLTVAFLAVSLSALAGDMFTVTRVVDGDTIKVWDGAGEKVVRLLGVDAPESQRNAKAKKDSLRLGVPVESIIFAGERAKAYVISVMPPGTDVRLAFDERPYDMYGRILAYIYLPSGHCLNELLLQQGYATVYRPEPFAMRERYLEMERLARHQQRAFWNTLWINVKE